MTDQAIEALFPECTLRYTVSVPDGAQWRHMVT